MSASVLAAVASSPPRGVTVWHCPFSCGQTYKRSSGRSIRRHVSVCFRVHHPATSALSDEQLSAAISEQQDSGQLHTGLRRWKMRQSPRLATELSDDDRWDCFWGCGKSYRATTIRSIQCHANTCYLRADGRTGDVDVREVRELRGQQQRTKRRTFATLDTPADHSSDDEDGGEAVAKARAGRNSGESSSSSTTSSTLSLEKTHAHMRSSPPRYSSVQPRPTTYVQRIKHAGTAGGEHTAWDEWALSNSTDDSSPESALCTRLPNAEQPAYEQEHIIHSQNRRAAQRGEYQCQPYQPHQPSAVLPVDQLPRPSTDSQRWSSSSFTSGPCSAPSATSGALFSFASSPSSSSSVLSSPPHQQLSWLSAASSSLDVSSSMLSTTWFNTSPSPRPLHSQPLADVSGDAPRNPTTLSWSAAYAASPGVDAGAGIADTGVAARSLSIASCHPLFAASPFASNTTSAPFTSGCCAFPLPFLSLTASAPLDLWELERQVYDELCKVLTSLYIRYGLEHPVFQQQVVSPQLLERALAHNLTLLTAALTTAET